MNFVVFLGPSLPIARAGEFLDARYLPPAAQGDVYLAALDRPYAIGIIDGYFERVPAVWHKEILWAMEHGIKVYGSASMGALRAAELHEFGMIGVGRIFENYRDHLLEDDDEVALIHGPADSGYVKMSEPMVNIRATFDAAEKAGIVDRPRRDELLAIAKSLHYSERQYLEVFHRATEAGRCLKLNAFESGLHRTNSIKSRKTRSRCCS